MQRPGGGNMHDILEEQQGGQCCWNRKSDREASGEGKELVPQIGSNRP